MSFQSFRLGEMVMQHPLPPHLLQLQQQPSTSITPSLAGQDNTKIGQRAPYGSGDSDDGYTLVFPSLEAFHEWRRKEEETQVVEFVKGDTHGSKAVPPRFKEHTKLVCARHSRSGRKKYVKKHPERIRKVPSRKIEGQGCPASISFKTYFDTDEIRVCYISQHSHEIGLANLPFTRKGRKAAAEQQRTPRRQRQTSDDNSTAPTLAPAQPPPPPPPANANAFSSGVLVPPPPPPQYAPGPPAAGQPYYQHSYPYQPLQPLPPNPEVGQDRWQNMETLFHSIREHARTFSYPVASIAALESVLLRLFLESPAQAQPIPIMQNHQHQHPPHPPPPPPPQTQTSSAPVPSGGEEEEESGSDESS
ncbi:hypothetical protein E1B28_000861 [Marasmius oreades]|uniref:Uncharacterized protein n=1 Tax=Marasmius oreades TaxID=181124 RepID=A0A9P7V2B6_9AGAR|nr:uncharacterized protein E1B28_000861 [Marasmius oreades]KAG7098974.1 hypothetical protein E1B28_000861 [Marasmius oreades]